MNLNAITKLYTIFNTKKWTEKEGNDIVYSNFCQLLLNLNEQQVQLLLELAERYTWISFSEYQGKIINVLNKIEKEKLDNIKKVILFPIMKPEDQEKTKSGHAVLYLLKAIKPYLLKYKNIKFEEIETFKEITNEHFHIKNDELIFLLDDYLGSGETIKATIEEILKNRNINPNNLNVISIAAQNDSILFLESINIPIYTEFVFYKGISDYYKSPELEEKVEIMKGIEKMIPANHFYFGFNGSEALVTLMRTPDNTFPIFWKEHKKNDNKFNAPFSRY